MFYAILWAIAFFGLLIATIVQGIYCLRCDEQARPKAIDTLLLLATLLVAVNLSAVFLPKTEAMRKAEEPNELNYVHKADLLAAGLTISSYVDRLSQPWQQWARLEGNSDLQDALKDSEKELNSFLERHPADPAVLGRLAIVVHESGGDAEAILEKKADPDLIDGDGTIGAIKDIYSTSDTIDDADLHAVEYLPANWYRNSLLLCAYKKISSEKYSELKSQGDTQYAAWAQRYIGIKLFTLLAIALSIPGWFILRKRWRSGGPAPVSYGFRKAYGCILFVLYTQSVTLMVAGIAIGMNAGFTAATHHTKLQYSDSTIPLLVVSYLSGAFGAWLSTKFFVCRPAGVGFQKTFWNDNFSMKEVLLFAGAGFCLATTFMFIERMGFAAIPHSEHGTNNPFAIQLIDSLVSGNPFLFLFCALSICLIAPVMEEILYRGLLYPWLRSRWGMTVGIIVSAVVFAAWHFDPPQFPALFVMGIVLAAAFECTRSLRVTTFMHAFWNTWILVAATVLVPR
jgi:membrane protease YdiL (CAAX protease family)